MNADVKTIAELDIDLQHAPGPTVVAFLLAVFEQSWSCGRSGGVDTKRVHGYLCRLDLGHLAQTDADLAATSPKLLRIYSAMVAKLRAKHGSKLHRIARKVAPAFATACARLPPTAPAPESTARALTPMSYAQSALDRTTVVERPVPFDVPHCADAASDPFRNQGTALPRTPVKTTAALGTQELAGSAPAADAGVVPPVHHSDGWSSARRRYAVPRRATPSDGDLVLPPPPPPTNPRTPSRLSITTTVASPTGPVPVLGGDYTPPPPSLPGAELWLSETSSSPTMSKPASAVSSASVPAVPAPVVVPMPVVAPVVPVVPLLVVVPTPGVATLSVVPAVPTRGVATAATVQRNSTSPRRSPRLARKTSKSATTESGVHTDTAGIKVPIRVPVPPIKMDHREMKTTTVKVATRTEARIATTLTSYTVLSRRDQHASDGERSSILQADKEPLQKVTAASKKLADLLLQDQASTQNGPPPRSHRATVAVSLATERIHDPCIVIPAVARSPLAEMDAAQATGLQLRTELYVQRHAHLQRSHALLQTLVANRRA